MILGIHSFEKLVEVYGEQGARNLASLARSKLILATADLDTAEQCARYIGNREVRQMDEAYSYGYNNTRDASTLTPRKQVEPLVIADDITNLPSMHGFVKFPDGFPAARIQLTWRDYPQVADGFLPRPDQQPVRSRRGDGVFGEEEDGEAGGRDGVGQVVAEVVEPLNAAKEMAARILSGELGEGNGPGSTRAADADGERRSSAPPREPSAQPARTTRAGADAAQAHTRDRDERREGRATSKSPEIEDQTIVELREDFADTRGHDHLDMGI